MSASQTLAALTTTPACSAHTATELAVGIRSSAAHAHNPGLFALGSTLGERHARTPAPLVAPFRVLLAVQRVPLAATTLGVAGAGGALADDLVALGDGVSNRAYRHQHYCQRHGLTNGNTARAVLVATVLVASAVVETPAPATLRIALGHSAAAAAQTAAGVSTTSRPDGASRDLKSLGNHRKHVSPPGDPSCPHDKQYHKQ